MRVCPNCDSKYYGKEKYCVNCGKELREVYFCPHCFTLITKTDHFCSFCGQKIEHINTSKYSDEQIEIYKKEKKSFERSEEKLKTSGALTLIISICLVLLTAMFGSYLITILFSLCLSLSILGIDVGIALLVVARAVYRTRINNRDKIIKEYEEGLIL